MKDPGLYLVHILETIEKVEEYTAPGRSEFMNNLMMQDATLRCLQTIGESVKRLPHELKDKRPEVDWYGIMAFRNVAVHEYRSINLDSVWSIVEEDLPILKPATQALFDELPKQP